MHQPDAVGAQRHRGRDELVNFLVVVRTHPERIGRHLLAQADRAGVGADQRECRRGIHHRRRLPRAERMQQPKDRTIGLKRQCIGLGDIGFELVVGQHQFDAGAVDAAGLVQRAEIRRRTEVQARAVGLLDTAVVERGPDPQRAPERECRDAAADACGSDRHTLQCKAAGCA